MQIYFGGENINNLGSVEGMLVSSSSDNMAFYYGVEFGSNTGGTDEVLIYDGIDRGIPVDLDSVPALIKALEKVLALSKDLAYAEKLQEDVYSYDTETHII